jgi:hypothetical protein
VQHDQDFFPSALEYVRLKACQHPTVDIWAIDTFLLACIAYAIEASFAITCTSNLQHSDHPPQLPADRKLTLAKSDLQQKSIRTCIAHLHGTLCQHRVVTSRFSQEEAKNQRGQSTV